MTTSPHSSPTEEAVLGALLAGDRRTDEVLDNLRVHHFWWVPNGHVYAAIVQVHARGQRCNTDTVAAELRVAGLLEQCHGRRHLVELMNAASLDPAAHARLLLKDHVRRGLNTAGEAIAALARTSRGDQESIEQAIKLLEDVAADSAAGDLLPPTSARVAERMRQIEQGEDPVIISTGIDQLDDLIGGGLRPGRMYVVAAESGLGKSAVSLQIADHVVRAGRPVLFVSYEMLHDELLNRRVSMATGLPTEVVENSHRMTGGAKPRILAAFAEILNDPLYIEDSFVVGMDGIRARTRRLLREPNGPPLVIVDYLQQAPRSTKGELAAQIEALAQESHRIAKLRVPVIVVAQMNRTGDIFGSGGIKRYSDVVIELEAVRNDSTNDVLQLNLRIVKQRSGKSNTVATFEPIGADFRLRPKRDISIVPGATPVPSRFARSR